MPCHAVLCHKQPDEQPLVEANAVLNEADKENAPQQEWTHMLMEESRAKGERLSSERNCPVALAGALLE